MKTLARIVAHRHFYFRLWGRRPNANDIAMIIEGRTDIYWEPTDLLYYNMW